MKCATVRVVVALGLLGFGAACRADEEKLALKDIPKSVADAIKARFPGAEMKEATKETADGKTTFEVSLTSKGKTVDVTLSGEGKITEFETLLEAKDLPKPVASAVQAKYPGATVTKAEEIVQIEGGKETSNLEVLLTTATKKTIELMITPEGKIVAVEEIEEN